MIFKNKKLEFGKKKGDMLRRIEDADFMEKLCIGDKIINENVFIRTAKDC